MRGLTLPALNDTACDFPTLHLLYGLVAQMRPALIVEAGTYAGHGAIVMAHALRENQIDGEIWTADVEDFGGYDNALANDLSSYITFYRGDYSEMLAQLSNRKIRLAFIDSGPVTPGTTASSIRLQHYQATKAAMNGGLIVVDDMSGQWVGVEEIRHEGIYLPQGRGLSLVQPTRRS